ncbi:MAG: ribonuclease P protein component [Paludibacter sp.]
MTHPNSFPKSEHLCGDKTITKVFESGEAFICYPLRVVYLLQPQNGSEVIKVLVGVPKKRFKRAVKRNRLKRLMREAYRLNKHEILEALDLKQLQLQVAFNYVSDEELDFETINKKMKSALQKLQSIIETNQPKIY